MLKRYNHLDKDRDFWWWAERTPEREEAEDEWVSERI